MYAKTNCICIAFERLKDKLICYYKAYTVSMVVYLYLLGKSKNEHLKPIFYQKTSISQDFDSYSKVYTHKKNNNNCKIDTFSVTLRI